MSEVYTYDGTHLTIVRESEFVQCAELGTIGNGRLALDDTDGTQAIVGHKDFSHTESACSFPLTFRGFVADIDVGRDAGQERAPHVGLARGIGVGLEDLNASLGFRGIVGANGKRPEETVDERMAWLLGSTYVAGLFVDNGRVASSTRQMTKTNYRNGTPGDVLADMTLAARGFNYHVNDWGSGPELTFRDDNASTADTSTLRISNDLADASAVTLHPSRDATLRRRNSFVKSKLALTWAQGTEVDERPATATAYNGERFGTASNSYIRTEGGAQNQLTALLGQHATPEDIIECTVEVTNAQVNLIRQGMRIQAKFTHMTPEGYGSFSYFRVLERGTTPIVADAGLYRLRLRLSPQEGGTGCSALPTFIQHHYYDEPGETSLPVYTQSFDYDSPTAVGNLLVVASMSGLDGVVAAPAGWNWPVQNDNTHDDAGGLFCNVFWKISTGDDSIPIWYASTSGIRRVEVAEYAGLSNPTLYDSATNRQDPWTVNSAHIPATDYPAGPVAFITFAFMDDGPVSAEVLNMEPEDVGLEIRSDINGGLHGSSEIGLADYLVDGAAGTTPEGPLEWRFEMIGNGPSLTVGMSFSGDNCGGGATGGGGDGGSGEDEPDPLPPGIAPFASPVTTGTETVPGSIDDTGATDVTTDLNDWFETVPDGSIVEFPTDGIFQLSEGVQLGNREHLDIRGNGSTFLLTGAAGDHLSSGFIPGYSYSAGSFTGGTSHVKISDFIIEGNDPTPGTFGGGENQQAVRANGSTFLEIADITVRAVYGDGVFLDNCVDVWVHEIHVETAGRNGLTVVQGARVLCESSLFDEVGYVTFDLEPNFSTEASDHITFRNNIAGTWDLDFVSVDGGFRGAPISNVFITGNVTTVKGLHCAIDNGNGANGNVGARLTNIVFTGNVSAVSAAGPRLIFAHIDTLDCTGNVQPLSSGVLTSITDSTDVTGP